MSERRDNLFLTASIIGIVLWIKYAGKVPSEQGWMYVALLAFILIPFCYILYLKRCLYQWSWEKIFYLFLLTIVGVFSFSNSILGIDPRIVAQELYESSRAFFH